MYEQETNNEEKKVINILPLNKGRRILVSMADFFMTFMLSFLLLVIACLPLGKVMTNYKAKNVQYSENLDLRGEILIGNKIMFNSYDTDISALEYHIDFTSDCFLSYYAIDEAEPANVKYDQFGHKSENQVFHTYFIDIRGESDLFCSLFDIYNSKDQYFERAGTTIILKAEVKDQIRPHFFKNESISEVGSKYLSNLKNNIFFPMYSEIMASINKNDLVYNSHSYNQVQKQIKGFEKYVYNLVQYTSIAATVLSASILYLLIPMVNKSRKTVGMMILKTERVNIRSLNHLRRREVILSFVYELFLVFLISFFIPMTTLSFIEMFKIQLLFILGIFSILMMLANLIFILVDKYNRSMFDRFQGIVNLTTAELDDVYRAKGYYL